MAQDRPVILRQAWTTRKPKRGRVVRIASVAALGGLLFGYDSAVINGAVDVDPGRLSASTTPNSASRSRRRCSARRRCDDRRPDRRQDRPHRGDEDRRAAVPHQCHRYRVWRSMSGWSVLFRVVGGIGVGVASVIAPAYIAEMSPPRIRGRLGSLQQLAIVSGIFVSLAVNCAAGAIAGGPNEELWLGLEAWRWMFLDDGGARASLYGVLAFTIPESPRYLVARHRIPEARKVLTMLLGEKNLEITIDPDPGDPGTRGQAVVARSAQADRRASTASSGSASGCRSSSSSSAST